MSGEPEPEDGSSSAPCLLLLQGDLVYHIFCKEAVLEITVSLLRGNQLTTVPSRVNTQQRGASHCMRTTAEIPVLAQLGSAHFCLPTSSWLSLGAHKNCKAGNVTFSFGLTTIWYCESMTHSQGSGVQPERRAMKRVSRVWTGACCPTPQALQSLRDDRVLYDTVAPGLLQISLAAVLIPSPKTHI